MSHAAIHEEKNAVPPARSFTAASRVPLQRKCACGGTPGAEGECEECRKKRLERNTRNTGPAAANGNFAPPIVHEVLRSPGQPLDAATRSFMEPRFGHDFSKVRVHTDARSGQSAKAVRANAYTVGDQIVFADSLFDPQGASGRELLAHELAHVVQNEGGLSSATDIVSRQDAGELTAYGEGWDWLTGNHPAERVFDDDDHMTAELRQHSRLVELRAEILHHACEQCASGPHSGMLTGASFNYSLAGWTGPFLYARDYIGVPLLYPIFGSALGSNPTVSFLGSFKGKWSANYECGQKVQAQFEITNGTNLTSGTRLPVLGYQQVDTPAGRQARPSSEDWVTDPEATYERMGGVTLPGSLVNPRPAGASMGSVTQRFAWSEELPMLCPPAPSAPAPAPILRRAWSPLEISAQDDPREREADQMARRALGDFPPVARVGAAPLAIQRQADDASGHVQDVSDHGDGGVAGCTIAPSISPSLSNCSAYVANAWWLPLAYVNNTTCACLTTPNSPTANCVRKFLQDRLAATPGILQVAAAAQKAQYENPKDYGIYQAYVQTAMTPQFYKDHVDAYAQCCCPCPPAPYWAWIGVSSVPIQPCNIVDLSIRYVGSCHCTPGAW